MKKTVILLIFAILLIAGISGYYLFVKKPAQEVPATETLKETEIATTTTEQIDTSDWKVYRSGKYKYEVKYPSNWLITTNPPNVFSITSPEGERINVFIQDNPKILSLQDWLFSEFPRSYAERFEDKIISGKLAKINLGERTFYSQFSDGKILSITYQTSEGPHSRPGLHLNMFLKIIESVTL